jgi:hypothetical protein
MVEYEIFDDARDLLVPPQVLIPCYPSGEQPGQCRATFGNGDLVSIAVTVPEVSHESLNGSLDASLSANNVLEGGPRDRILLWKSAGHILGDSNPCATE